MPNSRKCTAKCNALAVVVPIWKIACCGLGRRTEHSGILVYRVYLKSMTVHPLLSMLPISTFYSLTSHSISTCQEESSPRHIVVVRIIPA